MLLSHHFNGHPAKTKEHQPLRSSTEDTDQLFRLISAATPHTLYTGHTRLLTNAQRDPSFAPHTLFLCSSLCPKFLPPHILQSKPCLFPRALPKPKCYLFHEALLSPSSDHQYLLCYSLQTLFASQLFVIHISALPLSIRDVFSCKYQKTQLSVTFKKMGFTYSKQFVFSLKVASGYYCFWNHKHIQARRREKRSDVRHTFPFHQESKTCPPLAWHESNSN